MSVLLIEDDVDLGNLLVQYLEVNDIHSVLAVDGKTAYECVEQSEFELAIIDVMLPDTTGFEIAKHFKKSCPHMPFIFLTARNKKEDVITGLKIGADDYISKPFEVEELVLRINIALRNKISDNEVKRTIGESTLLKDELKLITPKKDYKLTLKECELIEYIIHNKNRLVKRESLLESVWGDNDYFIGRSMDVFISRVRKYFKDDTSIEVETFRGVGFIFRDNKSDLTYSSNFKL